MNSRDAAVDARQNASKFLLAVFLLAAALRLFAVFVVLKDNRGAASWEYGAIARSLVQGEGYTHEWERWGFKQPRAPVSQTAPFYVFFLALFYFIFGIQGDAAHTAAIFVQILISSATCIVIYKICEELGHRLAGRLAAVGMAVYPLFIYISGKIHEVCMNVFVVSLLVLLVVRVLSRRTWGAWLLCGFWFGMTMLLLPAVVAFFVFTCGFLLLFSGEPPLKAAPKVFGLGLMAILVITPWTIRNYMVHHKLVFIRAEVGYQIWTGNNPMATGTNLTADGQDPGVMITPEMRERMQGMTLAELDPIFQEEADRFIRENPDKFFRLCLRRIYYYWWFVPNYVKFRKSGALDYPDQLTDVTGWKVLVWQGTYAVLLALALAGIAISLKQRKEWRKFAVLYLMFPSFTAIYAISVVLPRHRTPMEAGLMVFAGLAASEGIAALQKKR